VTASAGPGVCVCVCVCVSHAAPAQLTPDLSLCTLQQQPPLPPPHISKLLGALANGKGDERRGAEIDRILFSEVHVTYIHRRLNIISSNRPARAYSNRRVLEQSFISQAFDVKSCHLVSDFF